MPPVAQQPDIGVLDDWAINKSLIVTFQILGKNRTYHAILGSDGNSDDDPYDSRGAVYYVIAVIMIYGISIVLLILATVRGRTYHNHTDKQVTSYLRNIDSIRQKGQTESILKRQDPKSLEYTNLPVPSLHCDHLPLISESREPSDPDKEVAATESDTEAYYSSITPAATPRMERRLSRSDSNIDVLSVGYR